MTEHNHIFCEADNHRQFGWEGKPILQTQQEQPTKYQQFLEAHPPQQGDGDVGTVVIPSDQ